jgi:hypothetical protein
VIGVVMAVATGMIVPAVIIAGSALAIFCVRVALRRQPTARACPRCTCGAPFPADLPACPQCWRPRAR